MNSHLRDVERWVAIDGEAIDRQLLYDEGTTADLLKHYTDGAVGAALSHIKAWNFAIETGKSITLAEDDAIFNFYFEEKALKFIDSLPEDWHYVLWGWNFDSFITFNLLPGVSPCVAQFDQTQMRKAVGEFQGMGFKPTPFSLIRAFGLPAYTISPSGAQLLKDFCLPIREMEIFYPGLNRNLQNRGIDDMMNACYPELNAYVCFPPLVVTRNDHSISTVQMTI